MGEPAGDQGAAGSLGKRLRADEGGIDKESVPESSW